MYGWKIFKVLYHVLPSSVIPTGAFVSVAGVLLVTGTGAVLPIVLGQWGVTGPVAVVGAALA